MISALAGRSGNRKPPKWGYAESLIASGHRVRVGGPAHTWRQVFGKVYENAHAHALRKSGLNVVDLLVNDVLMVELKAVSVSTI
jgi:hypothetical protein